MAGAAHFSLMDFKSRFWQVNMAPGSQPYMAFTVGNLGFYEFTQMPFGLCNTPATFQRLMQNTLGELNLCKGLLPVSLIVHIALRSVGECCETVHEFFVRVLHSTGVLCSSNTNVISCSWKLKSFYSSSS